jgi:hypothetical protein
MSYRWMFIALGLALLAGCSGCDSRTRKTPEGNALSTTTGRYTYSGNPCTTDPCLPGMAYAVLVDEKPYYLTANGHFFIENRSWADYTPEPGDLVTVTGYLENKKDVFGKPFCTIEVISLRPAR